MDKVGKNTLEIMSKAVWYNSWLFEQIKRYLSGDILEVGAGIGNFTSRFKEYGHVVAIDYDAGYENASYGDIEKGKYFFRNRKFDTIVCMNVLEHIKDDRRALDNMRRLLRKKGRLVLLVPAHQWAFGVMDKNLGHYRRYTKIELSEKLQTSNFKLQTSKYLNWLGLIGWFINGKALGKKVIPENQLGMFDYIARPFLLMEAIFEPPVGLSVLVIGEKK
ncbi:hypothetical protein A2210_01630 [Candidatus Woesebacteria bacterium RIFOXYA1_FULL_40_18]|uniref:Methyltransferase type 11 domain-containing protein n=3 Tax=Candidatus Woeseibacteriota TaxID=1752722 RepID=A0A1F8CM49_9BACT|nr:MAG: hypothetical protein A2210_01630 [Candidatus Woesebacteria bacterium RIFOXYA1_FULL_40_18]OGM80925.1 MAG: hypothetical protein A2361_01105 [Candidatus Woesebacteria bacterium RIFOXYB1_FULL_40_26]OGM88019.1 MAG: hypothetical protein A2614_00615 [Candidatus Woesebacteria bacterium RIFOXYD1_FULL_40_21]